METTGRDIDTAAARLMETKRALQADYEANRRMIRRQVVRAMFIGQAMYWITFLLLMAAASLLKTYGG